MIPPITRYPAGPAARTLARQVREAADRLAAAVHPLTARLVDCVEDGERPRLLYISGPFSDPDPLHGIERNILLASEAALRGWRDGWAVICPHKNTAGYQHAEDVPYETWIEGDLEILRRCDAICMLPGWENSPGARQELALAEELDMDVLVYDPIGQIRAAPSFYRLEVRA